MSACAVLRGSVQLRGLCARPQRRLALSCPNSLSSCPSSYPLLKLPLPGTGPVEFTTPVKDYSPPPVAPDPAPGEPSERPEWVGAGADWPRPGLRVRGE